MREDDGAYTRFEFDRGVTEATARGDQVVLFELLQLQAYSVEWSYRFEEAMKFTDQAERVARSLGDPARLPLVATARAVLHFLHGDTARAVTLISHAADEIEEPLLKADLMMNWALMMRNDAYRYEDARKTYFSLMQEALRLAPPEQYPGFGQVALNRLAQVQLRVGQAAEAERSARQALALAERIGVRDTLKLKAVLADTLNASGRPAEALRLLDGVTPSGGPVERYGLALSRVEAQAALGRPEALQGLNELRLLLKSAFKDNPNPVATFQLVAAKVYRNAGMYKEADLAMQDWKAANAELDKRANLALRTRYEAGRREQENEALRASQTALKERRELLTVGLLGSAVLLCVTVFLFWKQLRQKRRLAELGAELTTRNGELQTLHASRTHLLAAACHDLRQPAHALGMLAVLASTQSNPARQGTLLEGIRRSSETLADMLSSLMDMTQLEGGRYQPHLARLDIDDLLHEVELQYADPARRKGLTLRVPVTGLGVRSDRHLLRRILFNLVANAVRYTLTGSVEVLVSVEDSVVLLSVRDSGPGIPAERQADIFANHVRLGTSQDNEGLGIGLPIVLRATELLGHELRLVSEPGLGTTVSLKLPLAGVSLDPGERPVTAIAPLRRGQVALLEDDPEAREAMAALLRNWGFGVQASDGSASPADWLAGLTELPDLLITDLHLARGDSLDHLQALRSHPGGQDTPVLLLTGDLSPAVSAQATALGAVVAHKPLLPARLRARIDEALARP